MDKLLDECVFIIDTNVLLNLYRYPKTAREDLLRILNRLSELNRLWLPHQAALEFQRNRITVIAEQKKRFSQVKGVIAEIQSDLNKKLDALQLRKRHSTIDPDTLTKDVDKAFSQYMEKLEKLEKEQIDVSDDDKILKEIDVFLADKIGNPFSQEELDRIFSEGEKRFKNKQPPGFGDEKDKKGTFIFEGNLIIKREFGDLIIWKQIIKYAIENNIENLVFITDDIKEDWWLEVSGKTIGPRTELTSELYANTPVKHFHMYKSEQFLKFASRQLGIEVDNNSVEQVKVVTDMPIEDLNKMLILRRGVELRRIYKDQCQVCGEGSYVAGRPLVEVAHIMPFSRGGKSTINNMLCLCPNHHRMFDSGMFSIQNDFRLIGLPGELNVHPRHLIDSFSLKFHRDYIFKEVLLSESKNLSDDDIPF